MCRTEVSTRFTIRLAVEGRALMLFCAIVYSLMFVMISRICGCSQGDPLPALALADLNAPGIQIALNQPGGDFDGIFNGDTEVSGNIGKGLVRLGACGNDGGCFHVLQKIVSTKYYKWTPM